MTKKKAETEPPPPFEEAVDQIQQIIDDVESGEVALADSLERYAEGMKLLKHCRGILDEAEKKIKTLTVDEKSADKP